MRARLLVDHSEARRDGDRRSVARVDDRDDARETEGRGSVQRRASALGRVAVTPGVRMQPPPDLDLAGELREPERVRETGEPIVAPTPGTFARSMRSVTAHRPNPNRFQCEAKRADCAAVSAAVYGTPALR